MEKWTQQCQQNPYQKEKQQQANSFGSQAALPGWTWQVAFGVTTTS
jgi:hypothetical protein